MARQDTPAQTLSQDHPGITSCFLRTQRRCSAHTAWGPLRVQESTGGCPDLAKRAKSGWGVGTALSGNRESRGVLKPRCCATLGK